MANRKRLYSLPDNKTVTDDVDVYINAWRRLAEPLERELGLSLIAYDPGYVFSKGNPHTTNTATIQLPVWFVREVGEKFGYLQPAEHQ